MTFYTSVILMVILALAVLNILIYENNRIAKEKKNVFFATNILIACAALAECGAIHIGKNPDIPGWVLSIFKALDYSLTPLSGGALMCIMMTPKTKKLSYVAGGLLIFNILMQFVSIFTGWMAKIDETAPNRYVHGVLFYPVYAVLYSAIIIILLIVVFYYGKSFRKQNRLSLYATIVLFFIGILLQEVDIFGSELRVVYIALAIGSSFFFIHYSEFSQLEMEDKIHEQKIQISRDALTGVYSRFAYNEVLKNYEKNMPDGLAVFLVDINGLKRVNDTIGHEAGDELICGAAKCIQSTIGKYVKTYRIGGDEFVVFTSMTRQQAEKAKNDLENAANKWSGKLVNLLSLSSGFALANEFEGYSVEKLAKEADKAMYEEKKKYYEELLKKDN